MGFTIIVIFRFIYIKQGSHHLFKFEDFEENIKKKSSINNINVLLKIHLNNGIKKL